jgi:hypothetical protein
LIVKRLTKSKIYRYVSIAIFIRKNSTKDAKRRIPNDVLHQVTHNE